MPQATAHAWRNICCHRRCLLIIRNCCNRHWETRSAVCVAGLQELRSWMKAELFLTNYRPVPLTEYAVFKGCVYAKVNSCFHLADVHILLNASCPATFTATTVAAQAKSFTVAISGLNKECASSNDVHAVHPGYPCPEQHWLLWLSAVVLCAWHVLHRRSTTTT